MEGVRIIRLFLFISILGLPWTPAVIYISGCKLAILLIACKVPSGALSCRIRIASRDI